MSIDRSAWAQEQFAKMSPAVQEFVQALYAVRDDHIALAHTFDTQRPANSNLKLWEAAAIADVVRGLPASWHHPDKDFAPYCSHCRARRRQDCDCGEIADNE